MSNDVELLVTGDIHLGIHPSGIPGDIDGETFSPGHVWQSIVNCAEREDVDAVVITGDVIDRANKFYEAWGPFESGLNRLEDRDIPVYAVAGNHDAGVLDDFIESMGSTNCQLIGEGGDWERVSLKRDGEILLNLDGWSYPTRHVRGNPLEQYDLPDPQQPTLGVLHTDLNARSSQYAPVSEGDLKQAFPDGWLLGHIHKPELHSKRPMVLNPGSPQPLDPTEQGTHGPWVVTVSGGGQLTARQIPMATLEYKSLTIDVSELENPEEITTVLKQSVEDHLAGADPFNDHLEALSLRLIFEGEASFHDRLGDHLRNLEGSFRPRIEDVRLFVEKTTNTTKPPVDLEALADGTGPVARLAGLVRDIERQGPEAESLSPGFVEKIETALGNVYEASTYEPLRLHGDLKQPDRQQLVELIRKQGYQLLRELRRQKEGTP